MPAEEKSNADRLVDSPPLEIGSSKLKVMMRKKMMHQTTKSLPQEPHTSQSAPV
jgi:hypothetical protein